VLFVSLELITITFYVLTSFQRRGLARARSRREVSDLIGARIPPRSRVWHRRWFMAISGKLTSAIGSGVGTDAGNKILCGLALVMLGARFKIGLPFQSGAPDVLRRAAPALQLGGRFQKAAVLCCWAALLFTAVPNIAERLSNLLTHLRHHILYGNLLRHSATEYQRIALVIQASRMQVTCSLA